MKSTMIKNDYHNNISVNVSAEKAFHAINRVTDWWAQNVIGETEKLNENFKVIMGKTFVDFKITEMVPNKKVVWLVTDCYLDWINDKNEWKGTSLVFDITSKDNKTRIDVTHVGLVPEAECYNDCKKGWDFYIQDSLYQYLTKGEGKPQLTGKNKN